MSRNDFQIEFTHNGVQYLGFVRAIGVDASAGFSIILECENQQLYLEILGVPCASESEVWEFECGEGEDATHYYDKGLLEEIAREMQLHLNRYTVEA
jgi:hypothetical protein